eukprot:TRINITY_DN39926_c0_g1_i1.p1 TRINITY_DN39926_c0_g1~~TRINITY_DN39926_c0_g1_i1.p1  ORF type:complete len:141 (+),score=24.23 TRINITY_DN39926_c0_g1_i1:90-512(+)
MPKVNFDWRGLAVLACFAALSVMMYVFSMTLVKGSNLWPLMVFGAQIMMPIPFVLFGKKPRDGGFLSSSDGPTQVQHLGWWLTGMFAGFGLIEPIFMYNEGIMSKEQLGMMYGAMVLMGIGAGVAVRCCSTRADSGYDSL